MFIVIEFALFFASWTIFVTLAPWYWLFRLMPDPCWNPDWIKQQSVIITHCVSLTKSG